MASLTGPSHPALPVLLACLPGLLAACGGDDGRGDELGVDAADARGHERQGLGAQVALARAIGDRAELAEHPRRLQVRRSAVENGRGAAGEEA
ncbi:MAG: hypothetical protein KC457_30625, partial [Myxococcales bacterium]|nr:hypothetical protein [Myxococcales bacterium]